MTNAEPSSRRALATAIKRARSDRHYSIGRLAQEAGIAKSTISRWETGEAQPGLYALESIASVLDLTEVQRLELLSLIEAPRAARAQRDAKLSDEAPDGAMPTTGDLLRALRGRAGLRVEQLAAGIGVSGAAISKWERSERLPGPENVDRLARVLGASEEEKRFMGRVSLVSPRPFTLDELRQEYLQVVDALGNRQVAGLDLRLLVVESKAWMLSRREPEALALLGDAFSCHSMYLGEIQRWAESCRYANLSVALPYHKCRFDPHVALAWRHFIKGSERSVRRAISLVTDGFLQAEHGTAKIQNLGHRMRFYAELGMISLMEQDREEALRIAEPLGEDRVEFCNWLYGEALCAAGQPYRSLRVLPGIASGFFMLPAHVACAWAESLIKTGERRMAEPFINQLRTYQANFGHLNYDELRVLALAAP